MTAYSVADAKNNLPKLIDQALGGEEVIITRHGKPVIELRPATQPEPTRSRAELYEWLRRQRVDRAPLAMTSVELLNAMYEDDEG